MKRFDSVAIAFLFLMPALAGCLENEGTDRISADDIAVNPGTMVAGEFQPLVITAKKDLSVFIPNLVIDPVSNYVQNGTVLDMRIGETQQLISLAPPRIDSTFVFLSGYGTVNWPIRNSNESWDQWVNRNGMKEDGMAVTRVAPSEGTSLDSLNLTKNKGATVVPIRISVDRPISAAYSIDEGGLFSTGFVDGRTVYNNIARITDDSLGAPPDFATGYLDRWAGQGNLAYEDAAQFLIAEMTAYGLRVETQRFDLTDVLGNQNPEAYNICGFRDGTLYADEWLVFGAHFDIAPPTNAGLVDPHDTGSRTYGTRYGAYDNTAGTSMVLATAEAMADMPYDTRRTMVFCLWSGEEGGKRGSDYWTETLDDNHPGVIVTNYINLDMAGVNWPGGGGAPCGDEHGGDGNCDPDPQPDTGGYPKDSEVWPMRIYIGPSLNYNKIDQPDMVYLSQWIGADAINVSMQQDILVGSDNNSDSTWKYDVWLEKNRPEIIIYEDTTARSDHASFQDNLGTITLGYGGLVDGYWCYHQTCDTLEEMEDWMDTQAKAYGNNATGTNNLVNSLDMITWWATYSFFHMDERPILNVYLD
ncbi:MAG: M20/M25/M40 family metallo-hydrolase [Candidatus Poseidoniia archaeon]|nr:M20/M25/M40 family metallo-hydrolase [Candidatus Poseidoniia archaeon]